MTDPRGTIRSFLGLVDVDAPASSALFAVHDAFRGDGFLRKTISYPSDGETVEALLFEPQTKPDLAVVVLHQHNSEWHLGKSEVAGLVGDPLQAFGPALAKAGIAVLAPDAIGFESRRTLVTDLGFGASPAPQLNPDRGSTPNDWLQYYNHAMHRLARGELLMRRLVEDAANAVTVLSAVTAAPKVGIAGHSHGGNVALFAAALDTRIAFTVSSGSLCSYRHKFSHGIGLEMALVIPGFAARFDLEDLVQCIAPRSLLVVSSDDDAYSADADDVIQRARSTFMQHDASHRLQHVRTPGPHALDPRRFDTIVRWIIDRSTAV